MAGWVKKRLEELRENPKGEGGWDYRIDYGEERVRMLKAWKKRLAHRCYSDFPSIVSSLEGSEWRVADVKSAERDVEVWRRGKAKWERKRDKVRA